MSKDHSSCCTGAGACHAAARSREYSNAQSKRWHQLRLIPTSCLRLTVRLNPGNEELPWCMAVLNPRPLALCGQCAREISNFGRAALQ